MPRNPYTGSIMSYDNLRTGRCSIAGQFYMVTIVTAGRHPWFVDFSLARCVIAEMRHAHAGGLIDSLAWVLMPDHLHWLFQLGDAGSLARVMQSFKGRSARAINLLDARQRTIWQRGYHDHALRADEDVRGVARYLAANPVRAGLVEQVGEYSHWDAVWV
jgi:REP element-mobilizing transposase RayT